MQQPIDITDVAALVADRSRATMLQVLVDDRARTAGELARLAQVAPSTASEHLGRLTDGGLVAVEAQGRHRYYRLAGPKVAALLESMMALAPEPQPRSPARAAPAVGFDLRFARSCYDHLAGTVATALYDRLVADGTLVPDAHRVGPLLSDRGAARLEALGVDLDAARASRRPLTRDCLDWTERRHHLAGALGAGLLQTFRDRRWIVPRATPRALRVSAAGRRAFAEELGVDVGALAT